MKSSIRLQWLYSLLFLLLLGFSSALYWQGLDGSFILDDEHNITEIKNFDDHSLSEDMSRYVFSGEAGALGRPISLLSFALQFHNIHNVFAFKYVNLCIHLLIATCIFWLLIKITRLLAWDTHKSLFIALLSTALWLLSPIQVSTVLYVVQRMAQLSVLFTVIGLLCFVQGRTVLAQGKLRQGYLWASIGMFVAGIFAIFSKENGILLILYVLVLELTLFHKIPEPKFWKLWKTIFVYSPLLIIIAYFMFVANVLSGYEIRPFSLTERLLTESRILLDYLRDTFLPQPQSFTIFHDDYVISKNLITPFSTLPAVIIICSTLVIAWLWRKKIPVLSFAILWFFAGHALESTFLALMLYFEHRNYLAILGFLFAFSCLLFYLYSIIQKKILKIFMVVASGVWLLLLSFISYLEVGLWNNPVLQAVYWAEKHPYSGYAQSHAAAFMGDNGRPEEALKYYAHMLEVFPESSSHYIFWLNLHCAYPRIEPPEQKVMLAHFKQSQDDFGLGNGLNLLVSTHVEQLCPHISRQKIEEILGVLLDNPNINITHTLLYLQLGRLFAYHSEYLKAAAMIEKGTAYPMPNRAQAQTMQVYWLAQGRAFDQALALAKN
ncbi:hypothetical protein [Candidatus Venteria ishoeyi]|uniref:Tetratricopeptide repeat protein n=1 Tax=Candidatus Venteria ishoeyi TaxID=1899563 RepID=A0A1H6FBU8_9GAMM|nr:hypothetical protein [Candidatus Venteria ishoeyi]SEH06789.1 Uncharacterised protein [Candidatus Venteria ishoeyi]